MFKKIIGLALSLVLTTSTFAVSAPSFSNGAFYLAGDMGVFSANFNSLYNDQTDIFPLNISESTSQNGYTSGLAFGYSALINHTWSIGAELSGNIATQKAIYSSGASDVIFTDKIAIDRYADLVVIPGVMLTDTLLGYIKLGASVADITDQVTTVPAILLQLAAYTPAFYQVLQSSSRNLGFVAGLGLKKRINEHFLVFAEYQYHNYGAINFRNFSSFNILYTHTAKVSANAVIAGLSYQF